MKPEREFENTFAPNCENRTLTVREIICGLRFGVLKRERLPKEVREAVIEGEREREAAMDERGPNGSDPGERWKLAPLDTRPEIVTVGPKSNPILHEALANAPSPMPHTAAPKPRDARRAREILDQKISRSRQVKDCARS